ncbi:MAG: alpha/beta hydrolase [Firmicutes bacterium]|nr:alpha/beta hydrolase [Bacillota bacterium]
MEDYTKVLPKHLEKYIGENDLFLEIYQGVETAASATPVRKPPLLLVHGAYTGSWMWSRYIPHLFEAGYTCYVMNMRSHYKSRSMDMTRITFEDYLADIREILNECEEPPVLIGFSMGGILCQKIAEEAKLAGLVMVDTSISREVAEVAPYEHLEEGILGIVIPAPSREEDSIDESSNDITFQKKYLSMESAKAIEAFACWRKDNDGISVNGSLIDCPALVIKAVNSGRDDAQGKVTAEQLKGEYLGLWNTSHTGLLVGQRYQEVVDRILLWLNRY